MSRGDYTVCAFFTAAGKYASQLLKASSASYAKGLRLLQRSTRPFADRSLCLLCAGDAENSKQPGFYVEPILAIYLTIRIIYKKAVPCTQGRLAYD